jgi:hypothetical protein
MEETITFTAYGKQYTEKAERMNDAFYKIMSGYYFGCWVHIWSVITPNHKEAEEVSNEDVTTNK